MELILYASFMRWSYNKFPQIFVFFFANWTNFFFF